MAQIYGLVCKINEMVYVGCTKSGEKALKKRMREHRCLLRNGKHSEKLLQSDWNRWGEANFRIETLEDIGECAIAEKREREKWWMAWFDASANGSKLYNQARHSFEGRTARSKSGLKQPEEQIPGEFIRLRSD